MSAETIKKPNGFDWKPMQRQYPQAVRVSSEIVRRFSQHEMEDTTSDLTLSRALTSKVQADQQLEARTDQHQREWTLFVADVDRMSQM